MVYQASSLAIIRLQVSYFFWSRFGSSSWTPIGMKTFREMCIFQSHPAWRMTAWWQLKDFWNFHPEPWGRFPQFDDHIFFRWVGWNHQLEWCRDFFLTPGLATSLGVLNLIRSSRTFPGWVMRGYIPIFLNWYKLMAYENIYILSVLKFHSPRTHVCHHTETPILPVLNFTRSKSWNRHWFHRASTKGSALLDLMIGMLRLKKMVPQRL